MQYTGDATTTTGSGRAVHSQVLSQGANLQHDDARPHSAHGTRFDAAVSLRNSGPFALLFGPLKQHFGGQRFHDNELVEIVLREWL
jgi:hypothetical protein